MYPSFPKIPRFHSVVVIGGKFCVRLQKLRRDVLTSLQHQVVFILDEVMTSRLYPSGLHGKHGIQPDLITLGKSIGGGLAFGAFGGRKALLGIFDPRQKSALPHSGTFNNNTLTMAIGFAGLGQIYTPEENLKLNGLGESLHKQLQTIAKGTKMVVTGLGAVMTVHFLDDGIVPTCTRDIEKHSVAKLKRLFWFWCIANGYWIAERGLISLLLQTTTGEVSSFAMVVEDFIRHYQAELEI